MAGQNLRRSLIYYENYLTLSRRVRSRGSALCVPVMRGVLIVQAQEIDAVVVAVRRAHDGVDVEFGRLGVGQKDAGVMIELDEYHRALNAVVERDCLLETADPAKMRVGEMPLDLGKARGEWPRRQRRHIGGDEIEQIASLLRR